jgi:hypothetical protein
MPKTVISAAGGALPAAMPIPTMFTSLTGAPVAPPVPALIIAGASGPDARTACAELVERLLALLDAGDGNADLEQDDHPEAGAVPQRWGRVGDIPRVKQIFAHPHETVQL